MHDSEPHDDGDAELQTLRTLLDLMHEHDLDRLKIKVRRRGVRDGAPRRTRRGAGRTPAPEGGDRSSACERNVKKIVAPVDRRILPFVFARLRSNSCSKASASRAARSSASSKR